MISTIKRYRPMKKWSQIYVETAKDNQNKKKHLTDMEVQLEDEAIHHMSKSVANFTDFNVINNFDKMVECKHNIDNVKPPPRQQDWKYFWGTQLICDVCNHPAVNDCSVCKKCNIIVHTACISKQKKISGRSLFKRRPASGPNNLPSRPQTAEEEDYQCPGCDEAFQADLTYYNKMVERLREERLHEVCAKMIAKRMIIYMEKKHLRTKRLAIILIQSVIRRRLARKKFYTMRKSLLRIVIFEIKSLPERIMENGQIILTVFDTFKNIQLFRIDKSAELALQEALFFPGITAQMTLSVTVAMKEDTYTCIMIGQAQLCLRDIVDFEMKKTHHLSIMDKIKWVPQDPKHALFTYKVELPGPNSPYRNYFPSIADSTRTENESTKNKLIINFIPQNCVASLCRMVSAPPLDILKRSVDLGIKNKIKKNTIGNSGGNGNSANYRNSRYWLCLYKLKLILFQYYGDIFPRFIADITEATAQVVHDKGRKTSLVNVIFPDNRLWLFEFQSKNDANRFEFAVNESRKAKTETKGSRFINSNEFAGPDLVFGFSANIV